MGRGQSVRERTIQKFLRRARNRTKIYFGRSPSSKRTSEGQQLYPSSKLQEEGEDAKSTWASELPNELWAYRTTPRTATGESPFNLAFGVETVIPVEIVIPSPRVESYDEHLNNELMRSSLNLIEESREKARVQTAAYQQRVARYYNRRMKERALKEGDLVLCRAVISDPKSSEKLAPSWEGPY
ncbi:uncharacterized protein LOC143850386 [Tasmannia lanceolata]|uniref:uncharacterized protein LOC143850386 n=1 Tax=Tasmannia lanceolata TaxID=3420 RepID=UPI004063DB14